MIETQIPQEKGSIASIALWTPKAMKKWEVLWLKRYGLYSVTPRKMKVWGVLWVGFWYHIYIFISNIIYIVPLEDPAPC